MARRLAGLARLLKTAEADLIATVFKPEEGILFLQRQVAAVQIERGRWEV